MAEGIFKSLLRSRGISDVETDSAGTGAFTGLPASEHAVTAASELGADISGHRSKRVNQYLLDESDIIFCMTKEHAKIASDFVDRKKVFILRGGVPDPYGGNLDKYRACAAEIMKKLIPIADSFLTMNNDN